MNNTNREPLRSASLVTLALYLNGAAGSGKYKHISIDQVKNHLEAKTVFQFLKEQLQNDIDLTNLSEQDKETLQEEWLDSSFAIKEARKMCVDKGGLCLLVAYLICQIRTEAKAGR